jgi:hypothetical protein
VTIECEEDVNWVVLHLKQRLIGHYGLITDSLFLRTLCCILKKQGKLQFKVKIECEEAVNWVLSASVAKINLRICCRTESLFVRNPVVGERL